MIVPSSPHSKPPSRTLTMTSTTTMTCYLDLDLDQDYDHDQPMPMMKSRWAQGCRHRFPKIGGAWGG